MNAVNFEKTIKKIWKKGIRDNKSRILHKNEKLWEMFLTI